MPPQPLHRALLDLPGDRAGHRPARGRGETLAREGRRGVQTERSRLRERRASRRGRAGPQGHGAARQPRTARRGRRLPLAAHPRAARLPGRGAPGGGDRVRGGSPAGAHHRAAGPLRGDARGGGLRAGRVDVLSERLPLPAGGWAGFGPIRRHPPCPGGRLARGRAPGPGRRPARSPHLARPRAGGRHAAAPTCSGPPAPTPRTPRSWATPPGPPGGASSGSSSG